MTLLVLIISEAILLAAAALAVKTQLALFRGFDLIVAVAILASAEFSIASAFFFRLEGVPALITAGMVAAFIGVAVVAGWNVMMIRILQDHVSPGTFLFVFSLGASTAAAGLVGMLRGPGLRQMHGWSLSLETAGFLPYGSPGAGIAVGAPLLGLLLALTRQRRWLSIDLLSQDREFALEIGVQPDRISASGGVMTGLAAGFVGWYMAHASGSTPEIGFQMFLLGAGGALLLPGGRLFRAVQGGLLLGGIHVLLQLRLAPAVSMALLFVGVLMLLVWRGTSRGAQGVR